MENKELITDLFHVMHMFEENILNQHYNDFPLYQRSVVMDMLIKIFPHHREDILKYIHIKAIQQDILNNQN